MSSPNVSQLNDAAAAAFPGTPTLTGNGAMTGLHLYHAQNSICSQKVRAVLAATSQPYTSHLLNIFKGETYDPAMSACG